jgi:hypothetical protein
MIYIRNGAAAGFHSRIVGVNAAAPGWVDVLDPLPNTLAISDGSYHVSKVDVSMFFAHLTAQECADGITEYRSGYCEFSADGTKVDVGIHLEEVNAGPIQVWIAVSNRTGGGVLNSSPSRTAVPDLSNLMTGGGTGTFFRPLTYSTRTPVFTFSTYNVFGFWIKRIVPPNTPAHTDQQTNLVVSDQNGLVSKIPLFSDTVGYTPDVTVRSAPSIYTGGGARFRANVKAAETGLPVEGVPVAMRQTAGPGTFTPPATPNETDEAGDVVGHYTATTSPGDVGQVVTVEAEV